MNELALFAGSGGGILGGKLLGWRTVCAVEWDQYAATVLAQRQNDGFLEAFPIWDDVQTFDGRPWQGIVDVISGGFPCQDISVAGKGAGIDGERSGMWRHMARIIGEVRPRYVFVENSPMLVHRGLARVLGDLSQMGYDSRWCIMGADDAGAPHHRKRIWILAHTQGFRERSGEKSGSDESRDELMEITGQRSDVINCGSDVANSSRIQQGRKIKRPIGERTGTCGESIICNAEFQRLEGFRADARKQEIPKSGNTSWWQSEPALGRVAHGVAHRVDRLRAIGNGQVPSVAARAWRILSEAI